MLDLSNQTPPLDLRHRMEQYKINNSPYVYEERYPLVIRGLLRRNAPLREFVGEEDPFETNLVQLMIKLAHGTSGLLEGFYAGYVASERLVLIYHPSTIRLPIYRDNLVSLVSSRMVNLASSSYDNPMALVSSYQLPNKIEIQNVLAYHKMNWLARRNRLLGEVVCGIPSSDTNIPHTEVLQRVERSGFSLQNLTSTQREGYFFSPFLKNPTEI